MSKKSTKRPSSSPEPDVYNPEWLAGRIRQAGPVAVDVLVRGFDKDPLGSVVMKFSGDNKPIAIEGDEVDEFLRIENWIANAFAIGVAYGQRLQPGAFEVSK